MTKDQINTIIEKLETISKDMENDVKNFDGKPFDGKTVVTYFGYQGAAIAALANIIKLMIKKLNNENN